MNVLQVAQTHPPEWSGGSTFITVMLCRKLVQAGVGLHYLCGTDIRGVEPYRLIDETGGLYPVTKIRMARRTNGEVHLERMRTLCREFLLQHKFDIIHIHSTRGIGDGLILAANDLGIPVIVRLTDGSWLCTNLFFMNNITGRLCGGSGLLKCSLCQLVKLKNKPLRSWPREAARLVRNVVWTLGRKRKILESADHIVATCEFLVERFRKFGFRKTLDVIRNRIDEHEIARRPVRRIRYPVRFGSLGSFRPNKGGELLLEAIEKLRDCYPGFELHIWGPSDRKILERYRETLLSAPVILHDRYDRNDLGRIFSSMDVLVHTSLWDTLPIVVLESLASGTPVITSDSHGMKEVVENDRTGLLFKPGNAEDLTEKLRRCIENPAMIETMSRQIPKAEPFDGMVEEYISLYRKTLAERTLKLSDLPAKEAL